MQVLFGNSLPMHEFPGAGPATMMKVGTQVMHFVEMESSQSITVSSGSGKSRLC